MERTRVLYLGEPGGYGELGVCAGDCAEQRVCVVAVDGVLGLALEHVQVEGDIATVGEHDVASQRLGGDVGGAVRPAGDGERVRGRRGALLFAANQADADVWRVR